MVPQLILKFDKLTHGVTGISFEAPAPPWRAGRRAIVLPAMA